MIHRKGLIKLFKKQDFYPKWKKYILKDEYYRVLYSTSIPPEEWINHPLTWVMTEEGHQFWVEIDTVWRKTVQDYKTSLKYKKGNFINLGVEWEFWSSNMTSNIAEKYKIVSEYYNNMWECNNFFRSELKSSKEIEEFFEEILQKMKKIKKELGDAKISSKGLQIDDKSIVFNGLHIHLSFGYNNSNDYNKLLKFYKNLENSRIVQWYKLKELPSFRSLHSHHIWGKMREYKYKYKRKPSFAPVIISQHNTVELRIFDTEDLIYKNRREKLAKFIYQLWKDFEKGKEHKVYSTPFQKNGENMRELCKNIQKAFKNKPKLKHKILKDTKDYLILQANYQKIHINKVNNTLSLR